MNAPWLKICIFLDPPVVKIDKTELDNLVDEKDDATLRCIVDSNPPATISWRKEGLKDVFSPDKEIVFSPVTRHSAGLYSCVAENALGLSIPAYVDLDVKCKFKAQYIILYIKNIVKVFSKFWV